MITNCAIRVANKDILTFLKQKLNPTLVTECSLCGSLKVDGKDLARVLNDLQGRDDVLSDEVQELLDGILGEIIEPEPPFEEIENWDVWDNKNEKRRLAFLDGYETSMYIAYNEVVLYNDIACRCFIKDKKGRDTKTC